MPTLNDSQQQAVDHAGVPLIVLAGPGTGKTRVIITRLKRLLDEGAEPETLLALTFSVKAAEEMRSRLADAVGPIVAARVQLSTFHSFGKRIMDRFGDMIGLRSDPDLLDSAMIRRILRDIITHHDLFVEYAALGRESVIKRVAEFIAACRNNGKLPDEAMVFAATWLKQISPPSAELKQDPDALLALSAQIADFADMAAAYAHFDKRCRDEGLFTFDDLLTLPLRIFREKPHAAAIIRDECRHVLVDEFQDVNPAQIALLRFIAPPRLPNGRPPDLCVVGDDDQAIYGFRGSDPHAFARFAEIWTDQKTIPLTVNYRSTPHIIAVGNAIIARATDRFAPGKSINPDPKKSPDAGGVEGVILNHDDESGQAIAAMILEDRAKNPDRPLKKYAVIARSNDTLASIAAEMELAGVPVEIRHKETPLDDHAVQDLLAWIRLLLDQDDIGSAQRLLTRAPILASITDVQLWSAAYRRARTDDDQPGFADWVIKSKPDQHAVARFAVFIEEFRQLSASLPADRVVEAIVKRVDMVHAEALDPRERARRLARLVTVLRFVRSRQPFLEAPGNLASFWRYYSDLNETDRQFATQTVEDIDGRESDDSIDKPDAVQLLTAHKSKGLEFDTVFVAKVRPRGFPSTEKDDGDEPLPVAFSNQHPQEHQDEERRLFYVACTRAERRLVLLAKFKKNLGKTIDYFDELTKEAVGLSVPTSTSSEWLARSGAVESSPLESSGDLSPEARRKRILEREAWRTRQEAFAALHDAEAAATDPRVLEDVQLRLARSSRLIAALAALRNDQPIPGFILENSVESERLAHVAERLARQHASASFAHPMAPPLRLSYSKLTEYGKCPRCFYLKYVMGYDEPKTEALSVGDVVHKAIESFLKESAAAESDGRALPGLSRLLAIGEDHARKATPRTGSFDKATLEQIRAQLRNYQEAFHDDAQLFKPEGVVTFDYPHNGLVHSITAKIDRIDQLPDGRWRIADYKTGEAWKKFLAPDKDDLQMAIYAMALPWLIDPTAAKSGDTGIPAGVAEYWLLGTAQRGSINLADLKIDKVKEKIDKAIEGMLEGNWPRGSERDCRGHCEGLWDE